MSFEMELHGRNVFMLFCFLSVWLTAESVSKTQSLRAILNHFNSTRNVNIDPAAKQRAREYIVKTFKDHGLQTWTEEFRSNIKEFPGVNVVGRMPGRYTGTRDDKIVLIGSHYDSVQTSPGVDDNGSGITALLQALKLYTIPDKLKCSRDYTLLFVAFDLEEWQPSPSNTTCSISRNCSCSGGLCGSDYFVQNLTQYLNNTGAGFQGAIVLETILNYNSTPHSQNFPRGFDQIFGQVHQQISKNNFKGDFLAVIGREADDKRLIDGITSAYKNDENFKAIGIAIPAFYVKGRPDNWNPAIRSNIGDFFRSDHYRFWNAEPSLPAIFVTDSADFRGFMKQCYHEACDDISHVTPEMMTFLARNADSVVELVTNMTKEKCDMKKTDCIQEITASEGEIVSPYFDTEYPNNLDCAWTISVGAEPKDIKLKFTAFDVEDNAGCTSDYVSLEAGGKIIGKFCGSTLPDDVIASSQTSLRVRFISDAFVAKKGFKLDWTTSAARDCRPIMWQLLGFLVLTSLAIVL